MDLRTMMFKSARQRTQLQHLMPRQPSIGGSGKGSRVFRRRQALWLCAIAALALATLHASARLLSVRPVPAEAEPAIAVARPLAKAAHAPAPAHKADPSRGQSAIAAFIARRYAIDAEHALHVVKLAHRAAVKKGLDPVLIVAMMAIESRFDPNAVSGAGAKGLMQIIPHFHPEKFASDDPAAVFDPETNVLVGARILKEYLADARDLTHALQRYAGALADPQAIYAERVYYEIDRINAAIGAGPQRL
jgi:soluble lytic murein transglycosylase-like protein